MAFPGGTISGNIIPSLTGQDLGTKTTAEWDVNAQNVSVSSALTVSSIIGPVTVTGAITGSLTGNVTGNVTGNLTGNSAGTHTGAVTGAVTGNVTGNVTGDVTGNLTGNSTGAHNGTVGAGTPNTGAFTSLSVGTAKTTFSTGGLVTKYNNWPTTGYGVSAVQAVTAQKAESAADTAVLSFTPAAEAGTYKVMFVLSLSAANTATLGWTMTWKDSNGAAQSPTNLSLVQSGTAAPALTFTTSSAGNYYGSAIIDVDASATAIVVKLTFSGTSFAGKASATIERVQ